MTAINVGDRVEVRWAGSSMDTRQGTVIQRPSTLIAKVRFGPRDEVLIPVRKLRRLFQ